jgi:hypothetical protein
MPVFRPFFLMFMLVALPAGAENPAGKDVTPAGGLQLPDDIRMLLNQEMQAIRKGMESLVFDVASGNWKGVQQTGLNMKNSYIMAQRLSERQRHVLHEALPEGFRAIDRRFHHYAGMLSHVAAERDIELVHFYIYKMNEACASCHARYAAQRFSGFDEPNKHLRHTH